MERTWLIIEYVVVMFLWGVAILELDTHPDHNKVPNVQLVHFIRPIPLIDFNHTIYQATNPLIARPFYRSLNCTWYELRLFGAILFMYNFVLAKVKHRFYFDKWCYLVKITQMLCISNRAIAISKNVVIG